MSAGWDHKVTTWVTFYDLNPHRENRERETFAVASPSIKYDQLYEMGRKRIGPVARYVEGDKYNGSEDGWWILDGEGKRVNGPFSDMDITVEVN